MLPDIKYYFKTFEIKRNCLFLFSAHNAQLKKSLCEKGYTMCLCFVIECPNYLRQCCIVSLNALGCKKEFFLNIEICYKTSKNY